MDKIEQHAVIKFFVKKGLKAMEIHTEMVNVLGESATSKTMACKWASLFKSGCTSLEDDTREGRPKIASTPEIIEKIQDMVLEDRRLTERDLTEALSISLGTVSNILNVNLGFKKLCVKWVPHSLTMEQKHIRMRLLQHLERFKKNKSGFIHLFITMDEAWVYHHDPESKQEAKEWCEPGSSAPKQVRVQKSAKKVAGHGTTGYSPSQMLSGRDLSLLCDLFFGRLPDAPREYIQNLQARFEVMHSFARERVNLATEEMKTRYNMRAAGH
ncbi:uncharacterized protein LOC118185474 [Stegodyphus dumicola]|uniref:uncharacterized protein LOC118185474 n=1 Tax=Stegodyphus dumicola TaxID=202533 RepID=UPI0015AEFE23|nr:uncharacterized protein LOC118185474 [Stegodyphus dumicola]